MSDKLKDAQAEIDGTDIARMIMDFWSEFRGIYHNDVTTSALCVVGPLQAMIGLAIKNGRLSLPAGRDALAKSRETK